MACPALAGQAGASSQYPDGRHQPSTKRGGGNRDPRKARPSPKRQARAAREAGRFQRQEAAITRPLIPVDSVPGCSQFRANRPRHAVLHDVRQSQRRWPLICLLYWHNQKPMLHRKWHAGYLRCSGTALLNIVEIRHDICLNHEEVLQAGLPRQFQAAAQIALLAWLHCTGDSLVAASRIPAIFCRPRLQPCARNTSFGTPRGPKSDWPPQQKSLKNPLDRVVGWSDVGYW